MTHKTARGAGGEAVVTLPNFLQTCLFQSAGVFYHLGFCEVCPQPHWGFVATNSRSAALRCPANAGLPGGTSSPPDAANLPLLDQAVWIENPTLPLQSQRLLLGAAAELRDDLGAGYQPGRVATGMTLRVLLLEPAVVFEGHSEPAIHNKKFQVIYCSLTFPNLCAEGPPQLTLQFALADRCQRAIIGDIINVRELNQLATSGGGSELQVFAANTAFDTLDVPILVLCRRAT